MIDNKGDTKDPIIIHGFRDIRLRQLSDVQLCRELATLWQGRDNWWNLTWSVYKIMESAAQFFLTLRFIISNSPGEFILKV